MHSSFKTSQVLWITEKRRREAKIRSSVALAFKMCFPFEGNTKCGGSNQVAVALVKIPFVEMWVYIVS